MSKVFVAFALIAMIAAATVVRAEDSELDTESDAEFPAGKPRAGKVLKAARVPQSGRFGYHQKVVIVPKGDPRAQAPVEAPVAPVVPKEERIIVEADVFETPDPAAATAAALPVPGVPAVAPSTVVQAVPPTASRVLKAGTPSNAGACLAGYKGSVVAAKAAAYQTNYKSRGVKYSQPNRQFGITAKYADCSSFVTSILADTGYNCLFAAGRYTSYMNQQIRARGGYKQTAQAGDIVMWGGHTGLITRACSATTFTMVAMGNSGAGLATCKTVAQLKSWGSGGWLGFWTPRP